MGNVLDKAVIGQKINGVSMEDYIANMIERIERGEIEKEQREDTIKTLKQLNNRHKNIIDAQRVRLKSLELEIENYKVTNNQ